MSIKVYSFGARPKSIDGDLRHQMTLGRRYYNALVEAENARRQAAWGGERPPAPPHPSAPKKPLCRCAECRDHWAAIRKAVWSSHLDVKQIRAEWRAKGMLWCAYAPADLAFDAARKDTRPTQLLTFRSWKAGGQLRQQIMRAVWDKGFADHYYRIDAAEDHRTGRRAKRGGRKGLSLRLGKTWAAPVAFEQHRPLIGRVTHAGLRLWYDATGREHADVLITCADVPARDDLAERGVVAVDVSWRQVSGGLRIAYTRDDQGHTDQLVLGPRWIYLAKHADDIQSIRQKSMNDLADHDPEFGAKRAWLEAREKRLSPAAGRRLASQLGVLDYQASEALAKERHLLAYETGERTHSVNARKDAVRKWARGLRRKYATVVIKDSQHKEMKEKAREKKELPRPARRQGQHAAPGEVIEVLREVFGDENMMLVPAENTTDTCPNCGHINDHGAETLIKCERCGVSQDRDGASTRNMMALYADGNCCAPSPRKSTSKWEKRHKKKDEE